LLKGVFELAPMSVARAAHTATRLRNGLVLLAGGFGASDGEVTATAELFDPKTGSFVPTGAMSTPRQSHTATLLADGTVLIAGGFDDRGRTLGSAELYDPATGRFTPTGSLLGPRANATATLLEDGRVLVAGGTTTAFRFLATAELYDPVAGEFEPTGSMADARESHTATLLDDGRVLIAGGHRGRHEHLVIHRSAELYDPAAGEFAPTAKPMTEPRHKHDAVALADVRVLLLGGDNATDTVSHPTAEVYDPAADAFTATGSMAVGRYKFAGTSTLLANGQVLVVAGASFPELYDPATGNFHPAGGSTGRATLFGAAARFGPREVLLTGGYSTTGPATAQAFVLVA
jgi:hypothetical protein